MNAKRFAQAAYKRTAGVIGRSYLTIDGGQPISGVMNAVNLEKQDKDTGYTPEVTFAAVFDAAEFKKTYKELPKTYLGKIAKVESESYRVKVIFQGQTFVKIMLETIQKG